MIRRQFKTKPKAGARINWGHQLTKGLIGYWIMNEGAGLRVNDLANNNFGTCTNMAMSGATSNWAGSALGGCLNFDGVDDHVNIGDIPLFDTTFTNLSISAWVYPTSVTPSNKGVTGKGGAVNQRGFALFVLNGGTISFDNWTSASGTEHSTNTTEAIVSNKWYHLAGTFQGGVAGKVYINGRLSVTNTTAIIANTSGNNTSTLRIGDRGDGGASSPFIGSIDEVRIYNRVLSDNEVKQLYNTPHADLLTQKIFT